ncbi:MAG: septum formation initiator family protein [Bacteroidota bacterium]
MAIRNNPFKPIIKKIPAPLRNAYFILLALFFFWMIFFDKHDFLTQWQLQGSLDKLEEDKTFYKEKIKEVRQEIKEVDRDKEKFARENYFMKKDNEDVFIIVEEEK